MTLTARLKFALPFLAIAAPFAGAVPVELDLTNLRAIQTYSSAKGDDQAFVLIDAVAAGKDVDEWAPKDKAWTVGTKSPVASVKEPTALWKGELGEGEVALVSVTLVQGKNWDDPAVKEYVAALKAIQKKVTATKVAAAADFDKVAADNLKADQDLIKDVKKTLSRDPNVNHYGGLFSVLVWNNGGKIVKRLDPVGLTFGEHYGIDAKVYTKLKLTRPNVMVKDDASGDFAAQQLAPLSDDENAVRVKMLETEVIKGKTPPKHVTDYLVEVQLKSGGNPQHWELGGDHPGPTEVHEYWDFAK